MKRDKLLSRLQKLHALANDRTGNLNECAAAAARMQELMIEHRIEMAEVLQSAPTQFERVDFLDPNAKRTHRWEKLLLHHLCILSNCRLMVRTVGKNDANRRENLMVVGEPGAIQLLREQWMFVRMEIVRLCAKWAQPVQTWTGTLVTPSKKERLDFCVGASLTVVKRLEAERYSAIMRASREGRSGRALMLVQKETLKEVDAYCESMGAVQATQQEFHVDPYAASAGAAAASQITLNRAAALTGSQKGE